MQTRSARSSKDWRALRAKITRGDRYADSASEPPVQPPYAGPQSWLDDYCSAHLSDRHRCEHRDLYGRLCDAPGSHALSATRPAGDGLVENPDLSQWSCRRRLPRLEAAEHGIPGPLRLVRRQL